MSSYLWHHRHPPRRHHHLRHYQRITGSSRLISVKERIDFLGSPYKSQWCTNDATSSSLPSSWVWCKCKAGWLCSQECMDRHTAESCAPKGNHINVRPYPSNSYPNLSCMLPPILRVSNAQHISEHRLSYLKHYMATYQLFGLLLRDQHQLDRCPLPPHHFHSHCCTDYIALQCFLCYCCTNDCFRSCSFTVLAIVNRLSNT